MPYPTQEIEELNKDLAPHMRLQLGYNTDVIYLTCRVQVSISGEELEQSRDKWTKLIRDRMVKALEQRISDLYFNLYAGPANIDIKYNEAIASSQWDIKQVPVYFVGPKKDK